MQESSLHPSPEPFHGESDIVERLRFDAVRCELQFSLGVATNIAESAAEIERLRLGYRAIMEGLLAGRVGGEDVVWYDGIETLFDFCDVMVNGNEPREFNELKPLLDRALTAESLLAAAGETEMTPDQREHAAKMLAEKMLTTEWADLRPFTRAKYRSAILTMERIRLAALRAAGKEVSERNSTQKDGSR